MQFLAYSSSDVGNVREKNQDSIGIVVNTSKEIQAALGVVCDGVGGLDEGEYASMTTRNRFLEWFQYEFPQMTKEDDPVEFVRGRWMKLVDNHNQFLYQYAGQRNIKLGTTLTAILLYANQYFIIQVGDSRAYMINSSVNQLTEDQSLVAQEVRNGNLTKEAARFDPRKNVLLQSVGYARKVAPDFYYGNIMEDSVFLICSDGFYHWVEEYEMKQLLMPSGILQVEELIRAADLMINSVKERGETDNISVGLLRASINSSDVCVQNQITSNLDVRTMAL